MNRHCTLRTFVARFLKYQHTKNHWFHRRGQRRGHRRGIWINIACLCILAAVVIRSSGPYHFRVTSCRFSTAVLLVVKIKIKKSTNSLFQGLFIRWTWWHFINEGCNVRILLNLNLTLSKAKPFVAEEDIIVKVRSCTKYNKSLKYKKALRCISGISYRC